MAPPPLSVTILLGIILVFFLHAGFHLEELVGDLVVGSLAVLHLLGRDLPPVGVRPQNAISHPSGRNPQCCDWSGIPNISHPAPVSSRMAENSIFQDKMQVHGFSKSIRYWFVSFLLAVLVLLYHLPTFLPTNFISIITSFPGDIWRGLVKIRYELDKYLY